MSDSAEKLLHEFLSLPASSWSTFDWERRDLARRVRVFLESVKTASDSFHFMFDGSRLREGGMGFLDCPVCKAIYLPSVSADGGQTLSQVNVDGKPVVGTDGRRSVLQDWVHNLTFMQQSVLIAATRGPDGLHKDHVAKQILRWLRRCYLISAFDRRALTDPAENGGGLFTGPVDRPLDEVASDYLRSVDEIPHHFHLHLMHAAEILGYKHPDREIGAWWSRFYLRMVNDAHLCPETEERMDIRLGDNQASWRAAEEVVAK